MRQSVSWSRCRSCDSKHIRLTGSARWSRRPCCSSSARTPSMQTTSAPSGPALPSEVSASLERGRPEGSATHSIRAVIHGAQADAAALARPWRQLVCQRRGDNDEPRERDSRTSALAGLTSDTADSREQLDDDLMRCIVEKRRLAEWQQRGRKQRRHGQREERKQQEAGRERQEGVCRRRRVLQRRKSVMQRSGGSDESAPSSRRGSCASSPGTGWRRPAGPAGRACAGSPSRGCQTAAGASQRRGRRR